MKTVAMNKTTTEINRDGCRQVFGPKGKQYTLDDKTADALIKTGTAKDIGKPEKE